MIGKTISHYKILEKLGEGGMGVVYKAEDTRLKRVVALKFLPSSIMASESEKTRFVHEAQAAAALNHPNICTIYEIDEADGQQFIAMEFVEGASLKEKIAAGPLKIDEAINLATQIAEGLQAAHEKGITHRDIKPANVMITNKGQAKIMDFGLAKLAEQKTRLTKTGMTVGTVAYMSPEQAQGVDADHRSDIWSFGVMLYEMITGQHPFKGLYEQAVVYSIMNEEPEPMTGLRTGVPMELERNVNKALAKKPDERYQQFDEILVDLRLLQKGFASRISKQTLAGVKSPRKKRAYLSGAVVGLIALLIGIGFYSRMQTEEQQARYDSIAVLPLENLSADPDQEYLVDGMTEALIAELAQISALRVILRTSVMRYKDTSKPLPEIAHELNVNTIVEGSVLRVGERVRITAQLIDAATDRHLWAKSYERDLRDILSLQGEVAQAIASEIRVKLTPQEETQLARTRPVNPAAHDLYLKGRFAWNKRTPAGMTKSVEYFNQALEHDPTNALIWAGLADSYNQLGYRGSLLPREAYPQAKAAAAKALQANPALAEAHAAMGYALFNYDWDWAAAERALRRALELNPNYAEAHHWYSHYLMDTGRVEESLEESKRALELDPLSMIISVHLGWHYIFARQYDLAVEHLKKVVAHDRSFYSAHLQLGRAYQFQGALAEAIAEQRKGAALSGNSTEASAALAVALALAGQREEATRILSQLKQMPTDQYVSSFDIAAVYAGLGATTQTFEWLEKARQERASRVIELKADPLFDSLRFDPRLHDLLRRMNLAE